MGKTILLSIGGATYTQGGFGSESAALAGAELMWNTFGPVPTSNTSVVKRPFGDAVVDGFDLDFESPVNNMVTFANKLREYFAQDSKKYYLTAAPQCVFPDAANHEMLDGSVYFDAIWVQFYNNWCGVQNFQPDAQLNPFNFDTWDNWAQTTSKNPDVRVFVGVPAAPSAAGSGYQPVSALRPIIDYVAGFPSFGGIMMWDASQAYSNPGFISGVAAALSNLPPPSTSDPPTPTGTSSASSTTITKTTRPTSTAPPTGTVPHWGQVSNILKPGTPV
jgi:chitinase